MTENAEYTFRISVRTQYLDDQSDPEDDRFVFAYTIVISNTGERPAKLTNRHWIITDANGEVTEVRGQGVVGEQPVIKPGEQFQYTSGTVITTPIGTMEGKYHMEGEDGISFDTPIPVFSLAHPGSIH